MTEILIDELGVMVGLEIHQQLATNKKLFCNCKPIESKEYTKKFQRELRVSKSELGEIDPAALFEKSKSKTIEYLANPESSCLVEEDEEPPHDLDNDAKKISLVIASALKSKIFDEIYPMRKIVVDGSNTTGFQRTMLISQGGYFEVEGRKIGIQSICLEEDAAKIIGQKGSSKKYGLERLGIPLVEIATEPFEVKLNQIKTIALALGRILRSTRKVRRGLGSIRQDVNISIREGNVVIEIKGVQQLDQLEKVAEFEAKRQHGLLLISKKIQKSKWIHNGDKDRKDITELFSTCNSKIIQDAIKKKHKIFAISFKNMAGVFGYSPYEGIRLGKDIAELVRFFGIGGVFHSDELPNYGIEESNIEKLNDILGNSTNDGFMILATSEDRMKNVLDQIIQRITHIKNYGIPIDTRQATQDGETKFLRPRPGAARMYPETDIPTVFVSEGELNDAKKNIPKTWDDAIREIQTKYKINSQLSEQIFDSRYWELFERIIDQTNVNPAFVVSTLCSLITNLERSGLDSSLLENEEILKTFTLLENEEIAKESIEIIFENIMSGKSSIVEDAMKNMSIKVVEQEDVERIIVEIVENNNELIKNQKERAIGPLMGMVMKKLRGKASGKIINKILSEKIQEKNSSH